MNGTVKTILVFTLIIAIIAWFMGYINFDQEDYENYTFQEQAQIIGSQFNKAVESGTNAIKTLSDAGMATFNTIQNIIDWAANALGKIGEFFGITDGPVKTEDGWIIEGPFEDGGNFWQTTWNRIKGNLKKWWPF